MNNKRRMIVSACWIVLGLVLMSVHAADLTDEYWNGMGVTLVVVGIFQMIRQIRYETDKTYKAHRDVEAGDERNRFISGKAWAWAGYLYVIIGAAASMIFKLSGDDRMTQMAAGSVCLVMLLYWSSYFILRRKY